MGRPPLIVFQILIPSKGPLICIGSNNKQEQQNMIKHDKTQKNKNKQSQTYF